MRAFTRRILGATTVSLLVMAAAAAPSDAQQQTPQSGQAPSAQPQSPTTQPQSPTPQARDTSMRTPGAATPSPRTSAQVQARDSESEDDSSGDWGWIGLLGLAGLLGFRRRHDTRADSDRSRY